MTENSKPAAILPAGDYRCQIVASDVSVNAQGNGKDLCLDFEIMEGPHKGGVLRHSLPFVNPDERKQSGAIRDLSLLCHAVEELNCTDAEELHGRPMLVTVGVRDGRRTLTMYKRRGALLQRSGRTKLNHIWAANTRYLPAPKSRWVIPMPYPRWESFYCSGKAVSVVSGDGGYVFATLESEEEAEWAAEALNAAMLSHRKQKWLGDFLDPSNA